MYRIFSRRLCHLLAAGSYQAEGGAVLAEEGAPTLAASWAQSPRAGEAASAPRHPQSGARVSTLCTAAPAGAPGPAPGGRRRRRRRSRTSPQRRPRAGASQPVTAGGRGRPGARKAGAPVKAVRLDWVWGWFSVRGFWWEDGSGKRRTGVSRWPEEERGP